MVLIDTVLGERGEEEGDCKQHKGGSGRWLELPVLTLQRCGGVMLCIAVHWCIGVYNDTGWRGHGLVAEDKERLPH